MKCSVRGEQVRDNRDYPCILQGLFPGHPARHIQLRSLKHPDSGKKDTITLRFEAKKDLYAKHLDVRSLYGSWALGLMPGYPVDPKRWFVSWAGFDFDENVLKEVLSFVNILRERSIYVYLTKGTTGRGAHGYTFFTQPVSQPRVHNALKQWAHLAEDLGLGKPEIRPSNPYGPGTGILLPYRGAEQDGYGFNPLIDPITFESIALEHVDERITRTPPDSFLVRRSGTGKKKNRTAPSQAHVTGMGSDEAWEAELRRLRPHWVENKRQFLTLGAAAYGLVGLSIPPEKVKDDLLSLMREARDEEINTRRLDAVKGTIKKYEKGEPIAWKKWYTDAGIEAPRSKFGPSSETYANLRKLEYEAWCRPWRGKKGLSARAAYLALIRVAKIHGVDHPEGVEISISTRDLALEAGLSDKTNLSALQTLYEEGLAKRGKKGTVSKAGSFVLLTGDLPDDEDTSRLPIDSEMRCGSELPLRVRWSGLGKLAEAILEALLTFGPLERRDLAKVLWRKSRDLKDVLKRLEERGLVVPDEVGYRLPDNFSEILLTELKIDGSLEAERSDIQRYELQREAQQLYLYSSISGISEAA